MMQWGKTALDRAIQNKHIEVANILRNAPPKTEVKVRMNVSSLQYFGPSVACSLRIIGYSESCCFYVSHR